MSFPSYTLFLGDLSVFCTIDDLVQLFSPFGHIVDVRVIEDTKTGKKLSYGFVEYESIGSAINAMRSLNGCVVGGRHLRIQWGTDKATKKMGKSKRKLNLSDMTSSVHVTFFSMMMNVVVSEDSLRSLFSAYGCVTDVAIKKLIHNSARNSNEGYGFVHFTNINQGMDSAVDAVAALDNVTVGGVHYRVSMSRTLERSLSSLAFGTQTLFSSPAVPYFTEQMVHPPVAYSSLQSYVPYYVVSPSSPLATPVYTMTDEPFVCSSQIQHQLPRQTRSIRRIVTETSESAVRAAPVHVIPQGEEDTLTSTPKSFVPSSVVLLAMPVLVTEVLAHPSATDLQNQMEAVTKDDGNVKHSVFHAHRDTLGYVELINPANW